ncbi:MAG TPA: NIPSNAP family protein [Paraburkholderia sp.]
MIYELRTYRAVPGRLPDVIGRLRERILPIWARHGIRQSGFWTTLIGESDAHLIFMLAWESLAEREVKWQAFLDDPEWHQVRIDTESNGPIIANITNELLVPTDFSALK